MVFYTFPPNKSQAYLLNIEPFDLVCLKTYNTDFGDITIIFTDHNGRPLEIEDKVHSPEIYQTIWKKIVGTCF